MSNFDIIIGGVWNEVSDTKSQSARIRQISNEVRNCADSLNTCVNNAVVVDAVRRIASNILEEAAREESFSNALKAIAEYYISADKSVISGMASGNIQMENSTEGTGLSRSLPVRSCR